MKNPGVAQSIFRGGACLSTPRLPTLFAALLALAFLATSGCSRNKEGDNYTGVSADDPAMNAAIAKAKSTVSDFVRAFHQQQPGTRDFDVKKPYPTPAGSQEHIELARALGRLPSKLIVYGMTREDCIMRLRRALEVRDVAALLAKLKAAGVRLVDETPFRGAHGRLVAFVHPASTGGILLELSQRSDEAH